MPSDRATLLLARSQLPPECARLIGRVLDAGGFRGSVRTDICRELIGHFEDAINAGITTDQIIREFGEPAAIARLMARGKKTPLPERLSTTMDTLIQNLRYSARRLWQSPGFTSIALISLAVGIGANTAIFSLVNAILLRPQPFRDIDELYDVYQRSNDFEFGVLSYPDLVDVREAAGGAFEIAASRLAISQIEGGGELELVTAEVVTGNYFPMLGLGAAAGRTLLPEDDVTPGGHPVIMLSHDYWQRSFGGDPQVIGRSLRIGGRPFTIIGVAQRGWNGSLRAIEPDIYGPMMMANQLQPAGYDQLAARGTRSLFSKLRVSEGTSLEQVRSTLAAISAELREHEPGEWPAEAEITLTPTADVIVYPPADRVIRPASWLVLALVGVVLLVACINLASFLLARAVDRRREIAVRLALGATRRRLIGQLLTESVALSVLGGGLGLVVARVLIQVLMSVDLPLPVALRIDATLDTRVLSFALGISVLAGLVFGLVPALSAARTELAPVLRDESVGGSKAGKAALRGMLVVAQTAAAVVLLAAAGLFIRSMRELARVDPGFGSRPAAAVSIYVDHERYPDQQGVQFLDRLLEQIRTLPGVATAGATDNLHLNALNIQGMAVNVDGVAPPEGRDSHTIDWARVTPGYLAAAGIELVDGRDFDARDIESGTQVAIVNQAMANQFWPGESPVGKLLRRPDQPDMQVVGVVETARIRSLGEQPRPFVYRPLAQTWSPFATLVATTSGDPVGVARQVIQAGRELDPTLMIIENTTLERHIGVVLLPARLGASALSAFAAVALVLAAIGLYGIVSFTVARRTREVGIRLSLGADSGSVIRMLMGSGIRLVLAGGLAGLILALLVTRAMSGLVFGVTAADPITFIAVPLVLVVVAALATWIPARRAGRIDPVAALRNE